MRERRENESLLGYYKRVTDNRKEYDMDYSEWAMVVCGKEYSSENARKAFYVIKPMLDTMEDEIVYNISEDNLIKEIELKKLELEKERKKLQTTKIELNRNLRMDGRQELFYENIKDAKDRLPFPKFNNIHRSDNFSEYILAWADLHYGANFTSENNFYDREECKLRFERMVDKVNKLIENNKISKLHIFGLGDDIQGILRLSDLKINDIPVVESVVEVSRLIATVLNKISENVEIVYYHTMYSNHSQTRPLNGKMDLPREDLEFVIGNYIKDLLSDNPRVKVELTKKEYHSVKICGQNILAIHGHQIRSVKNTIKDYSILHKRFYSIALIGHFHGGQSLSVAEYDGNVEIKCVPSFVGSDPYSDSLKIGSKAMCKLYKIEEYNGITEEYTIILN